MIESEPAEQQTLDGAQRDDDGETPAQHVDEEYVDTSDDSQWYKGKARDDHKRRMRAAEDRRLSEDDPIQVCLLLIVLPAHTPF